MTGTSDHGRYPPLAVIQGYIAEGVRGAIGITGNPRASIVIDPASRTLGMRLPAGDSGPDVVDYENIRLDVVHDDDMSWYELSVQIDRNLDQVYAFLGLVIDRVQLSGETFEAALGAALDSLTGILAVRRGLTHERQVGLFGELLTLTAVVRTVGGMQALQSWRGPSSEEHDFGLRDVDLEVKTTLSERREHWISSATQLTPTEHRDLELLSIQLTDAPLARGLTLPGLVAATRSSVQQHLPNLDAALRKIGYRDRDAELYRSRWILRSEPAFFRVGREFPALTHARLSRSVPSAARITDVRYRIDLTGMQQSVPPFRFATQMEEMT